MSKKRGPLQTPTPNKQDNPADGLRSSAPQGSSPNHGVNEHSTGKANTLENPWHMAFAPETWPNWFLALIGLLGTLVALATLWTIKRQTGATEKAATAARDSVLAFIRAERAWIAVDIGPVPSFSNDTSRLEILWVNPVFTNQGKSPALVKRAVFKSDKIKHGTSLPEEPDYASGFTSEGASYLVPPNKPFSFFTKVAVSGREFLEIQQQTVDWYVYGFIDYEDIHGQEPHQTRFCFEYHVLADSIPIRLVSISRDLRRTTVPRSKETYTV